MIYRQHALIKLLLISASIFAVPTAAFSANAIVTENQKAGTTAWQIGVAPYQISNDTDLWIRGYASATSINKGEKITFNITVNPFNWKTAPVQYTIDVYRIGWYGGAGGRLMKHLGPFTGVQQPGGKATGGVTSPGCPYDSSTGMIACQWTGDGLGKGSYTLDTSQPTLSGTNDWTSGIYLAVLTTAQMQYGPQYDPDHQTYIVFAVREDSRVSDVLLQQSVATYQAYNNYPDDQTTGKSLYDGGSYGAHTTLGTQRAVKVSFDRPYTYSDHSGAGEFLKWEIYFVRYLESNGYDVTYTTDIDVHANGSQLLTHKVLLSVGHSEYWSQQMRTAVETARDQGTSIGFFGANALFSQIRLEPSPVTGVANRVVVAYKDAALDPVNNPSSPTYNPALTSIEWRSSPVNNAEQRTVGVMFKDWFAETTPGTTYIVQNSSNWLYTGTGLANGSQIPGVVGYEMDQQFAGYPLPSAVAGTYTLLSASPYTGQLGAGVANSSIYQAAAGPGAWVFGAGTIEWAWGLDSFMPAAVPTRSFPAPSAAIQQMTANFLGRAITGQAAPSAPSTLNAAAASGTSINMVWTNNSPTATAILVERSADNVTFTQITSLAGTAAAYSDTGLTANTKYYYRVRAQNAAGNSAYSNTANATTLAVPSAPTALTAAAVSGTAINLAWTNNSPTATAILVERSPDNVTFAQITSLAGTAAAYSDTGLTASTQYYYRVRAQNAVGNSAYSNTANTTTSALPAAPTALTAAAVSGTAINLAWTNNSPTATAILVERSPDNITFVQITSLAGTSAAFADSGLVTGTQYYYRVRAQNAVGNSAYSNTANTTTSALPAAPTALTAAAVSGTAINLAWTNNSPTATAILVERSPDNITFIQITSLAGTSAAFADSGLVTGTQYYYRVRAQNAVGNSAYSNTANATTSALPAAPTALTAAAVSGTAINLAWTNNSPTATAILVERSPDNITFIQITSLAGTSAAFADSGLITGTQYYYRVRAQNATGNSAYSNTANATTSALPPAPTALTASAISGTAINLAWTNNSPTTTAILVERSPDNLTFAQIASLAGTAATYSDTGLTTGTQYYYRVLAQNGVGNSAYSNTANATTSDLPPAPTALTAAVVSGTALNLAWTNNSPTATAILVERSPDNINFIQIVSLDGTAAVYSDSGLTTNTQYYYRVRAQNALGNSVYSNTANATTSDLPPVPTGLTATTASVTAINLAWTNNSPTATAILVERSPDNVTFAQIASLGGTAAAYADSGLVTGTQYYYRVRAQNAAGNSAYSNTANATTSALPPAPTALTATAVSGTGVNLIWTNNSPTASAILVERSQDSVNFTQIVSLAGTALAYSDAGLTTNTQYYYRVRAQNAVGNSAYSNTANATTSSLPSAPTALTAAAVSGTGINLTWTNNSPTATAILVERSPDNVTFAQIASLGGTASTYADSGLVIGTKYYYRARAQNAVGNSAYSTTANATTLTLPLAPTALTATAVSGTAINLTWTNNSPTATAILVERSPDNVTFTQITSLGGTANTYADSGLVTGTKYYYRVRAQNAVGNSAYSNTANTTTLTLPAAPSALTATASSATDIKLGWTNVSPTGTAILVESSPDNLTFTQIASVAGTATTYTNSGLVTGTKVYYRVRAQNVVGNSAYSNTANATTLALPAPTVLTATAASGTTINLTWTNNSPTATAILVERSPTNVTFTQIASLAGTAVSYANTGLTSGTQYYYRARAQNSVGSSAYSNTANATTTGVPPAPTLLTATAASGTAINLAWTNNSPTATAILVERSTNNVLFTQIASVAGTAVSYPDTGLTAATKYYYRVRAQNGSGTSAYSNTANVTTLTVPAAPSSTAVGQDGTVPRTQLDVYWKDNSSNETGFLIFRSLDNVTFTQVASVGANVTSYQDMGLTPNTRYNYYVKATNGAGTSAASNTDWTDTAP